ncbi:MAG: amino acid transporter [Verrucomicrobia bacterium]|nr:amino acid transporter [Verrucomicrobiota bacterium]
MSEMVIHGSRPRNVGWLRAAALLYGDWGTSKAYVIGLAVLLAGYAAPAYLAAIAGLTFLVGCNYVWVCRYFPEGGGVYHAARTHSARLAVVGALLLLADYAVTASMSCYEAFNYFGTGDATRWAILAIFALGVLNYFGPRLSSGLAVYLAVPMVLVVLGLVAGGLWNQPVLHWHWPTEGLGHSWQLFAGMVLALSGVEAVANTTGVMKPDPESSPEKPSVRRNARRAIWLVMAEVCLLTAALGILAAGMPEESFSKPESFLRKMAEYYVHPSYGLAVGVVVGLLLLSAVNTAIVATVAILYSMAQDGELPPVFRMLNRQGVPWVPLIVSVGLPILILDLAPGFEALASLYAIGVVGAITLNLASTSTDKTLPMAMWQRGVMIGTAVLMGAIWVTIAVTKVHALMFALTVCGVGLFVRETYRAKLKEETAKGPVPVAVTTGPATPVFGEEEGEEGGRILVAARGLTPSAKFALEEAKLRSSRLYFLYIREVQVATEVSGRLQDDPVAEKVLTEAARIAKDSKVAMTPVYCTANKASDMIVELAATLGADVVVLGGTRRGLLINLLRGDTVREVSAHLPEEIKLVVVG